MVNSFAENQQVWNGTVAAMSELDALMSLAAFAEQSSAWGPVCRPVFVEPNANGSQVDHRLLSKPSTGLLHSHLALPRKDILTVTGSVLGWLIQER